MDPLNESLKSLKYQIDSLVKDLKSLERENEALLLKIEQLKENDGFQVKCKGGIECKYCGFFWPQ
jgi:regulator of replication initiation timing